LLGVSAVGIWFQNKAFFDFFFTCATLLGVWLYAFRSPEVLGYEKPANAWHQYNQVWLNGAAALAGFKALYTIIIFRADLLCTEPLMQSVASYVHNLQATDFILFLVAFLGITGYLPYVILLKFFRRAH
jgi:hypothetical protein